MSRAPSSPARPSPESRPRARGAAHRRSIHYLPHAVAATALVVLGPALLVWWLRADGAVTGLVWLILIGVAAALALNSAASAWWASRRGPDDLLFSELLLWGWLRRWRAERKLANAKAMLARIVREDEKLSAAGRAAALAEVADALEAQDAYLDGHSRRVARHAAALAGHMGLTREEIEQVRVGAAVHDVGKLRIPPGVLNKPGALTEEEFALVKLHPLWGAAMVASLHDAGVSGIVRHHHERIDGTGYPKGLNGGEIPLGARIVAVVDTFDAITSARPYRPASSHREAIEKLRGAAGTQLDREAVEAFIRGYAGRRAVVWWSAGLAGLQGLFSFPGRASSAISARPLALLPAMTALLTATAAAAMLATFTPSPGPAPRSPSHGARTLSAHGQTSTSSTAPSNLFAQQGWSGLTARGGSGPGQAGSAGRSPTKPAARGRRSANQGRAAGPGGSGSTPSGPTLVPVSYSPASGSRPGTPSGGGRSGTPSTRRTGQSGGHPVGGSGGSPGGRGGRPGHGGPGGGSGTGGPTTTTGSGTTGSGGSGGGTGNPGSGGGTGNPGSGGGTGNPGSGGGTGSPGSGGAGGSPGAGGGSGGGGTSGAGGSGTGASGTTPSGAPAAAGGSGAGGGSGGGGGCRDHCSASVDNSQCHDHCYGANDTSCHDHCFGSEDTSCHDHCSGADDSSCHDHCTGAPTSCHDSCDTGGQDARDVSTARTTTGARAAPAAGNPGAGNAGIRGPGARNAGSGTTGAPAIPFRRHRALRTRSAARHQRTA